MYKFVKLNKKAKDNLPTEVLDPVYKIDVLADSRGMYTGWIYFDDQCVHSVKSTGRLEVLAACDVWVYSRYTVEEW